MVNRPRKVNFRGHPRHSWRRSSLIFALPFFFLPACSWRNDCSTSAALCHIVSGIERDITLPAASSAAPRRFVLLQLSAVTLLEFLHFAGSCPKQRLSSVLGATSFSQAVISDFPFSYRGHNRSTRKRPPSDACFPHRRLMAIISAPVTIMVSFSTCFSVINADNNPPCLSCRQRLFDAGIIADRASSNLQIIARANVIPEDMRAPQPPQQIVFRCPATDTLMLQSSFTAASSDKFSMPSRSNCPSSNSRARLTT